MRKIRTCAAALAAVLAIGGVGLLHPWQANAVEPSEPTAEALPQPFSNWDVALTPNEGDPNVRQLEFNSPLLNRRVTNTVYLPTSYDQDGQTSPVMYYLHGTVLSPLDNHALDPATRQESLLDMVSGGGGYKQTQLINIGGQLDKANFVVVAPDTDPRGSWCHTCMWIDGRDDALPNAKPATAEQVPADSYLHNELYPLVEALLNVRSDRGGRGVMGFSMGGGSALIQAMKHPDRYSFTGAMSGVHDGLEEPGIGGIYEALGYLRDQGYGARATNEVWWRNYNPVDLVGNLAGIDQKGLISVGDACLEPGSADSPDCRQYPPLRNPAATTIEKLLMRNFNVGVQAYNAHGVKMQQVRRPGIHGANSHRVYAEDIIPAANAHFAREVADPQTFSYRTVNPEFSVWGYSIAVDRPNAEFLSLSSAETDGRALTLTGSGTVDIQTPAAFEAGKRYKVLMKWADGRTAESQSTAAPDGRLPLSVDLGEGHTLDQNSATDTAGLGASDSVEVSIAE